MIRLRDKATGAEAEWELGQWSGDPELVELLKMTMRAVGLGLEHEQEQLPYRSWTQTQRLMSERLPKHGIVVVETTAPAEDWPSVPGVVY